ncbi:MAG: SgcJ/EcaC family oxidoreductase [Planctomycetales bacterium]
MRQPTIPWNWTVVLWLVCLVLGPAAGTFAAAPDSKAAAAEQQELELVRAASREFVKQFNAGNAQGLGGLFLENAEVADADGEVVKGRAGIVERFAGVFKDSPGMKLTTEVTSVRLLTGDVAVEDGTSTTVLNNKEAEGVSPYTVVYLKRDGKWMIARIRDFAEEPSNTPHDRLQALTWLLGEWVDESADSRVETTCRWSEDGNFLIQHYTVKTKQGNELKGTQRIAWDAAKRVYRSWIFDNSGGFGESTWTPVDDYWLVKMEGTTVQGETGSAVRKIAPVGVDRYEITSTARVLGNQSIPDSVVRVVRRPPKPGQK